ncbi:hypothetical protein JCM1840_000605 [Sporobolomyces johnsonii]
MSTSVRTGSWPRLDLPKTVNSPPAPLPLLADDWRHTGAADSDPQEHFSNFFTNVRIHAIREMQEQVVRDVGVPSFDFGEAWEGWQAYQQMVHPNKFPGGPVYVQALLHHIWMESQGRESWRLSRRRKLAPVVAKRGE